MSDPTYIVATFSNGFEININISCCLPDNIQKSINHTFVTYIKTRLAKRILERYWKDRDIQLKLQEAYYSNCWMNMPSWLEKEIYKSIKKGQVLPIPKIKDKYTLHLLSK